MLGKLIKLDIKFAYKKFIVMAALLLVFGFAMPYLYDTVAQGGAVIIFTVSIVIVCIMCVWLVLQHFQKNLFGPEGYLMFTLPVKPFQLLLSKLITTIIWFNIMLFSAIAMILLLSRFQIPFDAIKGSINWENIKTILKAILGINIGIIPLVLSLYMGISLSTVAIRNKKLGMGLGMIISIIAIWIYNWTSLKLSGLAPFTVTAANDAIVMGENFIPGDTPILISLAVSLAFSALFFFITTYIMRHKLNLD
ncbi:MAG: hypothetical protein PHP06_08990 [Clostridia bacterium]|nr:hypothetical protein [Clostridia bacterium]